MTTAEIISRLEARGYNPRGGGERGWTCLCPAHEDDTASLSVGIGDDGRTLLNCFAGCAAEDVASALGLTTSDLFAEPREREAQQPARRVQRPPEPLPAQEQLDGVCYTATSAQGPACKARGPEGLER
jgi:hypothetical protein